MEDTGPDGRVTSRVQVYAGTWSGDPASVPLAEGIMLRWTDPGQIPWLTTDPMTTAVIAHHRTTLTAGPPSGAPLPVLRVRAPGTRTVPNIVGVHLYAERDDHVLLGLRHPASAYAPSHHHFLAGHCEQESAIACLIREAKEEAGLEVAAADVEFVHVVHLLDTPGTVPRMQLVFRARAWSGEPRVMEPAKCVGWGWWPADALPEPTVAYTRAAIDGIRHGRLYTEMGWT
ncbi:NUDIX domain-containing protein [Streptomyces sp. NPDC048254]|uniref:NUDIX hydrolase n=1 Tax=Streptomyces sp. NPDC048254 TaxID=3365525 RepID=UPI0037234F32